MRPIAALLALLLLAPTAAAGTAEYPEAPDEEGDAPPNMDFADLLGVWLSAANGTLSLSAQVASMPQTVPGACWAFGFRALATEMVAEVAYDMQTQAYAATVGPVDGPANATAVVVTLGTPATLRIAVPRAAVAAEPGLLVELTDLRSCFTNSGGVGFDGPAELPVGTADASRLDEAVAVRAFSVPYPAPPPPVEKPKATPDPGKGNKTNPVVTPPVRTNTTVQANTTTSLTPASTQNDTRASSASAPEEKGWFGIPGFGILAVLGAVAVAVAARPQR